MKELFLFLIIKTFFAGSLHIQREVYVSSDFVYEEVNVVNPTGFDTMFDNCQIVYRNNTTTYIDTIRNFMCVDTLSLKNKPNSYIWELKSNQFTHDQSILTSVNTDSLLRCKIFNLLMKSNPNSPLTRRDMEMDVEVKTCRICTENALIDSLLNSQLELVLDQELGDEIHSELDQEFIFSIGTSTKVERGDIKLIRKSVRKTTDIELSNQSGHIKNLVSILLKRRNLQVVSKKVFFGNESLKSKNE